MILDKFKTSLVQYYEDVSKIKEKHNKTKDKVTYEVIKNILNLLKKREIYQDHTDSYLSFRFIYPALTQAQAFHNSQAIAQEVGQELGLSISINKITPPKKTALEQLFSSSVGNYYFEMVFHIKDELSIKILEKSRNFAETKTLKTMVEDTEYKETKKHVL